MIRICFISIEKLQKVIVQHFKAFLNKQLKDDVIDP